MIFKGTFLKDILPFTTHTNNHGGGVYNYRMVCVTDSTEEGSDTMGSEAEGDESEDCWDELSDDEVEPMESEDLELST